MKIAMRERWLIMILTALSLSVVSTIASAQADAPPVSVDPLPNDWQALTPTLKMILQFAECPEAGAYFQLEADAKEDLSDTVDLMAWAKLIKEAVSKTTALKNRRETELKESRIGNQKVVEYEITGELKGVKLHYRIIMLLVGDWYCKLTCWSTPSHWKAAQPKFEELVGKLKPKT
jgi:hypothetical protein